MLPVFINQNNQLLLVLEISGLHVNGFVSENTGAAIRHAIDRKEDNSTYNLVYLNLGHMSFKVSVVQHSNVLDSKNKPIQIVNVLLFF
jgi:molecular chaperone DnaK (HSP70)